jgi:hypothetical protein
MSSCAALCPPEADEGDGSGSWDVVLIADTMDGAWNPPMNAELPIDGACIPPMAPDPLYIDSPIIGDPPDCPCDAPLKTDSRYSGCASAFTVELPGSARRRLCRRQ